MYVRICVCSVHVYLEMVNLSFLINVNLPATAVTRDDCQPQVSAATLTLLHLGRVPGIAKYASLQHKVPLEMYTYIRTYVDRNWDLRNNFMNATKQNYYPGYYYCTLYTHVVVICTNFI